MRNSRWLLILLIGVICATPARSQQKGSSFRAPGHSGPLSLSAPDGQGLILEKLDVRAAVHGMLSLTELDMVFRNPTDRRIEGKFRITLPENATVSRFAKEVDGHLMEGEVVERLQANRVYEQFLHQMRDPALLEQDQGNQFSARVFPIDPKQPVHLILSYSQLLPSVEGRRAYTLPLRGISRVGAFTFRATLVPLPGEGTATSRGMSAHISTPEGTELSTTQVASITKRDFVPDADLALSWEESASSNRVLSSGDFYLASLRLPEASLQPPSTTPVTLYVDTSASAATSAAHRIEALEAFLSALPPTLDVEAIAFDQKTAPLLHGPAREVSRQIGARLRSRLFLGGTDFGNVLSEIVESSRNGGRRYLLVTDGIATLGKTDPHELLDIADRIGEEVQVDGLVIGSRQSPFLAQLVSGRGRVLTLSLSQSFQARAVDVARRYGAPLGPTVTIDDNAAEWVYPNQIHDLQPGQEIFVLGRLKAGRQSALRVAGPRTQLTIASAERMDERFHPLLEREAYRAYLDLLGDREVRENDPAVRKAIASERVKISIEKRVLIPTTSLLVLESESDYARFNLDRRALSSILTVGAAGIEVINRVSATPAPLPVARPQEKDADSPRSDGRISGRVTSNGRTLASANVSISGLQLSGRLSAAVNANGEFEFVDLPEGSYNVRFEASDHQSLVVNLELGAGASLRLDRSLVPLPRIASRQRGEIGGTVRLEGNPVPGATVTATVGGEAQTAVTDVSGSFSLSLPPGDAIVRYEMESMMPITRSAHVFAGRRIDMGPADMRMSAVAESITITTASPAVLETLEVSGRPGSLQEADEATADGAVPLEAVAPPAQEPALQTTEAATSISGTAMGSAPSPAPLGGVSVAPPPPPPTRSGGSNATATNRAATPADIAWTREAKPDAGDMAQLEEAIKRDPTVRQNYTKLSDVLFALEDWRRLEKLALQWQQYDDENVQVYESLGEAALALGEKEKAIRAFGSLVDVASDPEILQRAGLLLMRAGAGSLAEAPLRRALELRPDRVNTQRNLALYLWQSKRFAEAAAILEAALTKTYPQWYGDVHRVISEELGYVYRAWGESEPGNRQDIAGRASRAEVDLGRLDRLRITLTWETDANDVDLHVVDPAGEECFYSHPSTGSGLQLYGDITQGLGPEVTRTDEVRSGTYAIGVNYFSAGPMGVSRGLLVVLRTDRNRANPDVEILPFRLVEDSQGKEIRLLKKIKF
jgi:tetratricopeptide (TPR) repeat protein